MKAVRKNNVRRPDPMEARRRRYPKKPLIVNAPYTIMYEAYSSIRTIYPMAKSKGKTGLMGKKASEINMKMSAISVRR